MFEAVIRHGTILAVGVLVICVLGTLAALGIPVQMIPDLDVRVISVQTRWRGATPQDGNPFQLDMTLMRDFVDDYVRTRMERVEGVSQVNIGGGAERQVRIRIDPGRLAERGITLSEVRNAALRSFVSPTLPASS